MSGVNEVNSSTSLLISRTSLFGNLAILRNTYWLLRHGRSLANEQGIIVSALENGVLADYGLSPEGLVQAAAAGALFKEALEKEGVEGARVTVVASPFSRTQQTAQAVTTALGWSLHDSRLQTAEELRERYFGPSRELQSHDKYLEAWIVDARNPRESPPGGGESVVDVALRLAALVCRLEAQYLGFTVLLVAHGDTLSILQATLSGVALISDTEQPQASGADHLLKSLSNHRRHGLQTGQLLHIF